MNFYGFLKEIVCYSEEIDAIRKKLDELNMKNNLPQLYQSIGNGAENLTKQQLVRYITLNQKIFIKSFSVDLLVMRHRSGQSKSQELTFPEFCQLFSTQKRRKNITNEYPTATQEADPNLAEE